MRSAQDLREELEATAEREGYGARRMRRNFAKRFKRAFEHGSVPELVTMMCDMKERVAARRRRTREDERG